MFLHRFTLRSILPMMTFNIRETGNELLRILEKDLRWSRECRLTIDLLVPDVLKGDRDRLITSILLICQCLDSKPLDSSINIELSIASHSSDSLNVKIDVKGISNKRETTQQFLRTHRVEVDALLARLPYPTMFSANGVYVRFSFNMLFFDADEHKTHRIQSSGKKVLLVEDDDITALVFTSFMEEWEYIVTRVSDGASAVEAATLRLHDIILMDTFLPKMSGIDAIRKIRELDKKIPIIALTTSPFDKDFADRYAGANDVLIKPVGSADLQRILKRYS